MSGTPDSTRKPVQPYLISRDEGGGYRLTCRDTRYNGQGYPIVTTSLQSEIFRTAGEARAWAKTHFGAEAGQFATK